jgi:hypothetical protein
MSRRSGKRKEPSSIRTRSAESCPEPATQVAAHRWVLDAGQRDGLVAEYLPRVAAEKQVAIPHLLERGAYQSHRPVVSELGHDACRVRPEPSRDRTSRFSGSPRRLGISDHWRPVHEERAVLVIERVLTDQQIRNAMQRPRAQHVEGTMAI